MSNKRITTDLNTLRQLVDSPGHLKKILITALLANITLITAGVNTLVSDHYAIKNLISFSIESKQIITEVNKKVSMLESSDAKQEYRITKIEDKRN